MWLTRILQSKCNEMWLTASRLILSKCISGRKQFTLPRSRPKIWVFQKGFIWRVEAFMIWKKKSNMSLEPTEKSTQNIDLTVSWKALYHQNVNVSELLFGQSESELLKRYGSHMLRTYIAASSLKSLLKTLWFWLTFWQSEFFERPWITYIWNV